MNISAIKRERRTRRHKRIRAKVFGNAERPRLTVYKSNTGLYAQVINDERGVTIVSTQTEKRGGTPQERSHAAGVRIAELAKQAGVSKVVFDRGGVLFAGRVKAFALGAREGGLIF